MAHICLDDVNGDASSADSMPGLIEQSFDDGGNQTIKQPPGDEEESLASVSDEDEKGWSIGWHDAHDVAAMNA